MLLRERTNRRCLSSSGNESAMTGPGVFTLTILDASLLILPLHHRNKKDWLEKKYFEKGLEELFFF